MNMITALTLVATGTVPRRLAPDAACRVTALNGIVAGSAERQERSYGNALLSVAGLWPEGTIVFKPGGPGFVTRDGALGMKFPWMRAVRGQLRVTGHRLDGAVGPLRLYAPDDYDDIGRQPSYLIFATPGCWEVTAQVGDRENSKLTFITKVVKIGDGPARRDVPGTISSKRMADGKEWTTANVNIDVSPSYCYDDGEPNCRRYGRLYTWQSAQRVCHLLGDGWRLPTDDEWRQLTKRYSGVSEDSADAGHAAFTALLAGGASGLNGVLGGNRSDGHYERLGAHGFYWTASDNDPNTAPYYNFAQGGEALHRQPQGEKQMAISVRCLRD